MIAEPTKAGKSSPSIQAPREPVLTPLVPEERIDPESYIRWRRDVIEEVRR